MEDAKILIGGVADVRGMGIGISRTSIVLQDEDMVLILKLALLYVRISGIKIPDRMLMAKHLGFILTL